MKLRRGLTLVETLIIVAIIALIIDVVSQISSRKAKDQTLTTTSQPIVSANSEKRLLNGLLYLTDELRDDDTGELNDWLAIHVNRRIIQPDGTIQGLGFVPADRLVPSFLYSLLRVRGVGDVALYPYEVRIKKGRVFNWEMIVPEALEIIEQSTREMERSNTPPEAEVQPADCMENRDILDALKELWEQKVEDHAEKKIGGNA